MKRLSTIVSSLIILIIIIWAGPVINEIPVGVLAGLMIVVAFKTIYWKSILLLNKIRYFEIFTIIVVMAVTILWDLAIAVGVGLILEALNYVFGKAKDLQSYTKVDFTSN